MAKLWRSKDWPIMAMRGHFWAILGHLLAILPILLEILAYNLVCPSFLSSITSKPIFSQIGLEIPMLAHKNHWLGHFDALCLFWTHCWPLWTHFWRYFLIFWFAHRSSQVWLANQFLAQSDLKCPFKPIKTTSLAIWTLWVHFGSIIDHYDPIFRDTFL